MITIPTFQSKSSDFEMNMDLEEVNITIRLTYNIRVNYWFAEFSTENNSIKCVKVIPEGFLLKQYKATLNEIKGDFILLRGTNSLEKPELTYDNLGVDWFLFYLSSNEVNTWEEYYGI